MRPVSKKITQVDDFMITMDVLVKTNEGYVKFSDIGITEPVWNSKEGMIRHICQKLAE